VGTQSAAHQTNINLFTVLLVALIDNLATFYGGISMKITLKL
jgi:hypothetical protein